MNDADLDILISRGAPEEGDSPEPIELATLVAYREGTLSAAQVEAVEAALAADPDLRALLVGLANPPPRSVYDWAYQSWPTSRRRWLWGAAATAAAAAGLMLWTRRSIERPRYQLEGPFGGRVEARDQTSEKSDVFHANSQVRIVLRAATRAEQPIEAAVFQIQDGVLKQRTVKITQAAGGIRLTGSGEAFFGDTPGPVEVVIGVAESNVSALDGRRWDTVQDEAQWMKISVRYEGLK